jgi:hypothetical protein
MEAGVRHDSLGGSWFSWIILGMKLVRFTTFVATWKNLHILGANFVKRLVMLLIEPCYFFRVLNRTCTGINICPINWNFITFYTPKTTALPGWYPDTLRRRRSP